MRTIAITNQKGGSGKTTTSVNLAAALAKQGKKILVMDLDPQASASSWLGITADNRGILEVFLENGELQNLIQETNTPNLDLIPASSWLVGAEKAFASELGAESYLKKNLEKLPHRWDYILLDCPPSLGLLTVWALVAAREIIVPVEAHVLALAGLAQLTETVGVVQDRLNHELAITGVVLCRYDGRTRHSQEIRESLKKHFSEVLYETVIRENIRIAEAPSFAQPITHYDPSSNGSKDYMALAKEFLSHQTVEETA